MKKVLNFLMVLLMAMGLGMASGMTAFQAEAAETSGETALAANQDGDKGADAKKAASVFMMRQIFCRRMKKRR